MAPNTWAIYKKAGFFKWEFVEYFPDPDAPQPMFRVPDVYQRLKLLSEIDNRRRYRACLHGEDARCETRVKTTVTPQAIIKEVVVIPT